MWSRTRVAEAAATCLAGCGLLAWPLLAAAQANAGAAAAPAEAPQRVEITGSRLLSLDAQASSPLQVLSAEDIARSGAVNVQDVLQKLPTVSTPAFSRTNSNFLTASAGVATVDLRGFGPNRTLVLVNGRRFVAGIPTTATVDLNTIPAEFIERVEVLTGGSSATYGSDAIAGVVNIILKRQFDGVVVDVGVGRAEAGDDSKQKASITFGTSAAAGKAHLMTHLAYSRQGAVYSKDRPLAGGARDSISTGLLTGDHRDFFSLTEPFFSSFAPQGRFFPEPTATGSVTFDRAGNVIPFSTNGPAGDGVGATGFNRQEYRTLAIPTQRFLFASKGDIALAEGHSAFAEGTFAATSTRSRLEPFPLDSVDIYAQRGAGRGRAPAEALVGGVVVRHPLVPDAIYNRLRDTDGDGLRDYGFTRRLAEVGSRGNSADRNTFRLLAGLRGTLAGRWDYEVFGSYGRTTELQSSTGQVNVLNMRHALDAVPDSDDVNGNGNRTEAICRDAGARAQGCVPINLFGYGRIGAQALAYVVAPGSLTTFTSQKNAGASITGEAFVLPAGGVAVAAGVEHRQEYSRAEYDALQASGLNAGNALPPVAGSFDVDEVFAEARIPLLQGLPGVKQLSATLALRLGDYSTVGRVGSRNAGAEWTVAPGFRVRAMQAVSTRAPDIGELYAPPSQTFPTGLADPCVGVTAVSTQPAAARCRADAGVAANIAANGSFRLTQPDQQGISGFNIGNPNLRPEKGRSTTLGLVVTPQHVPALRNSSLTIDYFRIRVDDAIGAPTRQFILDQCYAGDASFCRFVRRRAQAGGVNSAGSLEFIDAVQRNSGGLFTEGVDITAAHAAAVGPGRLSWRLSYTRLLEGYSVPAPGSQRDPFAGEVGFTRDKAALTLGYASGAFGMSAAVTHIGRSALDDKFLAGFAAHPGDPGDDTPPAPGSVTVPARTYADLQFTYTLGRARFTLGIDNAFDTKPPLIPGGLPSNITGTNTAADIYDAIGRRYHLGLRLAF
jgi:outer membrane receptor protein involved in Fe transport